MNKVRKIKLIALACCLLLLLTLVGCGGTEIAEETPQETPQEPSEEPVQEEVDEFETLEPVTLVFAHGFAPAQTWSKGADKFKEVIEEKTNGKLTINMYGNQELGEQRQNIEDIITTGTVDMTITMEPLSFWHDDINLYQLLYLFRDKDHLIAFEEGPVGQEFKDRFTENTGLKVLTYFSRSPRQMSTNTGPVNSLEDLSGIKIRVTESRSAIEGWRALGANPVPMAWGEVFTALNQGVIDAQENPFDHMVMRKTYEVTSHGVRTNHIYSSVWVIISEDKYNSLPEAYQRAIDEAVLEMHDYEKEIADEEAAGAEDALAEVGFEISEPDLVPFREAASASWELFQELEEWIEKVDQIQ